MTGADNHASPWFVYLITNFDPTVKTNSFVGVAQDPEADLNSQHYTAKAQSGVNPWRLEIVIGPCPSQEASESLRDVWTARSRGITSRRNTGKRLFCEHAVRWDGLRCFDVVAGA